MLEGYSKNIQSSLKKKNILVGQRVAVEKGSQRIEGYLMPTYGDENHIVLKLDNGYNTGIAFDKNTRIHKLPERREPKKAVLMQKHKPDKGKPTIAILHVGGTVASRIDYKTGAVKSALSPEDIYQLVPEIAEIANIKTRPVFQVWSQDMEPEHWITLAKKTAEEISLGVDGIIITHGTAIMHYTSAALSFMLQSLPVPVIIVGSQRSSDRGSSDAAMNLVCAAHFIAKSDFAGVAVCMHGSSSDDYCFVHEGTNVRKMHTTRRDTFRSIDVMPYAKVFPDGEIEFLRENFAKKDKTRKLILKPFFDKNTGIVKVRPGIHLKELEFYFRNFRGIVLEGMGLGHLPSESTDKYTQHHKKLLALAEKMAKKRIILLTSQCPYGRVNMNVYDDQRKLAKAGIIPVRMTTETAFVKLSWALGCTGNRQKALELINTNIAGEIVDRIDVRAFYP